ncbi:putative deoxyribonuclease TATDN1-like protein [Globomyces pollinis-pini]|nr:putative deoxyribonuclease TATDN1-like protein [Globomyces pollinis-pini]
MTTSRKMIDIAINLVDPMFRGIYRGKNAHEDDLLKVLERAKDTGVCTMLITGVTLETSKEALSYANKFNLFSTAGCHPTHSTEFEQHKDGPLAYYDSLRKLIVEDQKSPLPRIKAIGECGLDYDRLQFADKDTQRQCFIRQFDLANEFKLPIFFHNRNTGTDFIDIVKTHRSKFSTGVVHSFDGSLQDMITLTTDLDLYIGINGCSLKTQENLDMVSQIPLTRLMIETDAPWCDVRPTHASYKYIQEAPLYESKKKEKFEMGKMVKSRNEPCTLIVILGIIAKLKDVPIEDVESAVFENTCKVFNLNLA